ncbi:MAG: translocation/assembly module TamB domain-containing protein, partial [Vicinamibacteria bacterium]
LVGRTAAEVSLDGTRARVRARAPGLGAFVDGTVSVAAPHDYRAVIVVDRLDLVPPAIVAGAREDRVTGTLSLSALATGRALEPESLDAAINLQALDATVGGVPIALRAPARLRWIESGLTADEVALGVGAGELRASGRFSEEQAAEWRTTLDAEAAELVAIAQAFAAVPDAVAARGRVALDWRSAMNARQADATIAVTDGVLQWEDLPPLEAVQAQVTFDGTTVDVPRVTGTWQGGGLEASARLPRALFEAEAPAAGDARGFAKARLTGLAPGALAPWVDAATLARMTGRLSATLDATVEAPSLAGVRGTLVLDEAEMTVDGVPVAQRQPSRFTLADGRLDASDVEWNAGGSALRLTGHVDVAADVPVLDLGVTGRADLRVAGVFDPTIATDGGADVDIRITGTSEAPAFNGRITLDGVEMAMRDPQVIFSDVRGRIDLAGDRVTFQEITGEVNGGRLVVVGGVTHEALALTGGTVIVQMQGAALEYPLGLQSEADALLQFTPGPGEPRLFGDVRILRSGYVAPISLPALVAANRAAARPLRGEPSYADTIRLNIAVETVTDMVVDNNYGRFEAGAQVRVVGTIASPGVVGRATLREGGQMYLAGNTFRIERGAISFIGQNTIEPDFDIEVRTQTAGQDVSVSLSGTLDRLETDVRSSDPNVATEELVSLLLGGTGAGFGGADALRLFSAELLGATGRAFGLDSLRLERGL